MALPLLDQRPPRLSDLTRWSNVKCSGRTLPSWDRRPKNMKKAEQKARREAKRTRSMGSIDGWAARRASEGDAALLTADGFKISSSFESNLTKAALPPPPPASNL